mmetsp:Transcript_62784/g.175494  ORF Transcript_62784/g.175494 Transcript_62784/m.175494 type:complete len:475 (-) Transcript_62784:258-1682(-)
MSSPIAWTENIVLMSDSYKISHYKQYPQGTEYVYSYFESRGCDNAGWDSVCFFGLQYFLKRYMVGEVVTQEKIEEAAELYAAHFSDDKMFFREGWEHIAKNCGGKLPVEIKCVPEGMVIPNKTVLFTMVNTDPKCYWLTNFLETLLVQVWYPMTVCTNSRFQKLSIYEYMKKTGNTQWAPPNGVGFKLHDFGFRGVSSVESAATGGVAHLVNFLGTDTMSAVVCAREFYGEPTAGFSIPASEHSTITSWGREGECNAMKNMLEKYPKGIVACVSDSYNIFKACEDYWGGELKSMIEQREGMLVVRPDSGELPDIVLQVLEKLEGRFGSTKTPTGHKLLPPCIRVIQGDGIDIKSLDMILKAMTDKGWAADNLAFGSGGALLQKLHRDTQKVAFKCSFAVVNGEGVDVVKDPITDPGKKSKKGRLTLELQDGKWVTTVEGQGDASKDQLVTVFKDGVLLVDAKFATIRERSNCGL